MAEARSFAHFLLKHVIVFSVSASNSDGWCIMSNCHFTFIGTIQEKRHYLCFGAGVKLSGKQLYFPNMHHLLPLIFCPLSIPISSFVLFASHTDDQISLSYTKLCRLPCASLSPLGGTKHRTQVIFCSSILLPSEVSLKDQIQPFPCVGSCTIKA